MFRSKNGTQKNFNKNFSPKNFLKLKMALAYDNFYNFFFFDSHNSNLSAILAILNFDEQNIDYKGQRICHFG